MRNESILLIEDNPDDVAFTRRAFEKNNFHNEIVVAADGAEALDMLLPEDGSTPIRPSTILLDVNLPKINGLDVLRQIRSHPATQLLPVVVLSTSNEESDIQKSYRGGANSYVRKPVMFGEFVDTTKVLGTYWLAINENAR